MALRFFNTLTRMKEDFKTVEPNKVKMYTCGPTVYDFAHIGNFRAYIFGDLLRRYLEYKGYEVLYVMNLTDIDDKTIKASQKEKISLDEYTSRYKKAFFEDVQSLHIKKADIYPEATKHIKEMVEFVKVLLDKGYAYQSEGSTYYKISAFPKYGKLSHIDLQGLKMGARVSSDEYEKEQLADFALWKGWEEKDGEIFWETEIGKGRPGWHIECSVMSMQYLGKTFDIHTGGVDLIFPHHENEIAQSEAVTEQRFVNFWMHNEHLLVNGRKMAKSFGNFYTLRDLLNKGYNPIAVRYLLLATHYRQQLNFTLEGLEAAKNALQRLYDFIDNLSRIQGGNDNPEIDHILEETKKGFEEALDDDLNTSEALGKIFDMVKEINILMDNGEISQNDAQKVIFQMEKFDTVLGILSKTKEDDRIQQLIDQRDLARKNKDFALADKMRKKLEKEGLILRDTALGTIWRRKI